MKLTKILMCALAVGAMIFATGQAQAKSTLVIDGNLYVPITVKGTFTYVDSKGKISTRTATSKQIISQLGYAKGIILAIGPGADVYAINNGVVITNLSLGGYFHVTMSDTLDTSTGDFPTTKGTYSEVGVVTLDFASDRDLEFLDDNTFAFNLTGTYTYNESDSAVVSDLYKQSSKFSSKNLGGLSYVSDVDEIMPVSGSASGSASGSGVTY
ncbi:MAG: hypothetical protein ABSF60_09965 [Verrucomicrobiota bacterium]|jgi:hypothetical protein